MENAVAVPIVVPDFDEAEQQALLQTLQTGWVGQGPQVDAFERYLEKQYQYPCVALHSCTAGLHLSLLAAGVQPGDEVAVPAFSFIATANAVEYCGAKPRLIDVDPSTYNIDAGMMISALKQASSRLKAMIVVHEFGLPAPIDAIQKYLPANVRLIEDAACAYGSTYQGKPVGNLGDFGCFSLHPRKVVTCGEGGWIVVRDAAQAVRLRRLRNHGLDQHFDMPELGFNYRLTDLQAAMAMEQLKKANKFVLSRQQKARYYSQALATTPHLQLPCESSEQNYQSYVVALRPTWLQANDLTSLQRLQRQRDQILAICTQAQVGVRLAAFAMPQLSYYRKKYGWDYMDTPGAMLAAVSSIALPLYPSMSEAQQGRVIEVFHAALQEVVNLA